MSVCAAKNGVFAHPSQDPKNPLKNIEYGYHFQPRELRKLINKKLDDLISKLKKEAIKSAEKSNGEIKSLTLSTWGNYIMVIFLLIALMVIQKLMRN